MDKRRATMSEPTEELKPNSTEVCEIISGINKPEVG